MIYEEFLAEAKNVSRNSSAHCWWAFRHVEEGNVSAARNKGFSYVPDELPFTPDFVVPLDEDDVLHPEYLERMKRAAEQMPGWGVFYPDWAKMGGGYVSTPEYSFGELKEHPFIVSCSFISIDVWRQVAKFNGTGYDETLVRQGLRWEDYLFYLTAGALGVRMARVAPGALVKVRPGGEGGEIANSTLTAWYDYANHALEPLKCQLQPPTNRDS
jgi:glycosyltransferase involved in cell wall biosynthesis